MPTPLQPADSFRFMLEDLRHRALTSSPPDVYEWLRGAAMALLRGEECLMVTIEADEIAPGDDHSAFIGEHGLAFSRLLAGVISHPIPAFDNEVKDQLLSTGTIATANSSAMCIPVLSGGQLVACFTVTRRTPERKFDSSDVQLAEVISALAGAALDHMAGHGL
jgi:hypothetical protein